MISSSNLSATSLFIQYTFVELLSWGGLVLGTLDASNLDHTRIGSRGDLKPPNTVSKDRNTEWHIKLKIKYEG